MLVEPGKAFHDAWDTQNLHHTGWLGFEHDGTSLAATCTGSGAGWARCSSSPFTGLVAALIARAGART